LLFGFALNANTQPINFALGYEPSILLNEKLNKINNSLSTGFKPVIGYKVSDFFTNDSLNKFYGDSALFFSKHKKNWFYRKFFFESFVKYSGENFLIEVNPLLNYEIGRIKGIDNKYGINTRGIEIKGNIGEKLSFYSSFAETQAFFRYYIDSAANERLVVPGQGAWKEFKETGRDFSMASGYVSFSPNKIINLQAGHDKHFIGEGYRSLLLSDNSFNYPFARLSFDFKGFNYTVLYTQFEDFRKVYYAYHTKKYGQFNYLSYSYKNIAELGVFEGMIYKTSDSITSRKIPADYFVPVIGLHLGKYGYLQENKLLTGINLKIKITEFAQFYAQLASDDFKTDRNAYQFGVKIFDAFINTFPQHRLYFQAEYNNAKSDIYKGTEKNTSWSHYNSEIVHPAGTRFDETILIGRYLFKNFSLTGKYVKINSLSAASDIFINTENIGNQKEIIHNTLTFAYLINPNYFLQVFAGADIRKANSIEEKYIFFGIRTNISNFYYDF